MRNHLHTVECKGRGPYLLDIAYGSSVRFLRICIHASARTISPDHSCVRVCSVYVSKMVYSTYKKQRILYLYSQGYRPPTIKKMLDKENLKCSRVGIYVSKELHCYSIYQQKSRLRQTFENNGRNKAASRTANESEQRNYSYQLHRILTEKGYSISLCTILRCRTALGWTF